MTKERTHAPAPKQAESKPTTPALVQKPSRLQTARRRSISQPGDALEQEAERIAAQMGIPPNGLPLRQRSRSHPALPVLDDVPSSVERTVRSAGQPLHLPIRALMEARFRHDFSGVQVHTDSQAQQSARDVDANAYTVGDHIVFGRGQFDPVSAHGQRLIAHELTHVVQQSERPTPAVQRQSPGEGGGAADAGTGGADGGGAAIPGFTPESALELGVYDFQDMGAGANTAFPLLGGDAGMFPGFEGDAEDASPFLDFGGEADFGAGTDEEGFPGLLPSPLAQPAAEPGADTTVPLAAGTVTPEMIEYTGVGAGNGVGMMVRVPALALEIPDVLSASATSPLASTQNNFVGAVGERSALTRAFTSDLNVPGQTAFETVDIGRRLPGVRPTYGSAGVSLANQDAYARTKFRALFGEGDYAARAQTAATRLVPNVPQATAEQIFRERGRVLVPSDRVADARTAIRNSITSTNARNWMAYRRFIEFQLGRSPVTLPGNATPISNWVQFQALSAADQAVVRQAVSAGVDGVVTGLPITSAQLTRLVAWRSTLQAGWGTGWTRPFSGITGRAGGTEAFLKSLERPHAPWHRRALDPFRLFTGQFRAGGALRQGWQLGGSQGGRLIAARSRDAVLRSLARGTLARGAGIALAGSLPRYALAAAGKAGTVGAIIGVAVEGGSVLWDMSQGREVSGADATARIGSGVIGIAGSAAIGAAIGSVVPVAGTAVGLVVGILVGVAYEIWARPAVENAIRETVQNSSGSSSSSSRTFWGGHCFTGDTLIQMADGTARPIVDVREGDEVLGMDEKTGKLRKERVTAVHVFAPIPYLALQFSDDNAVLRVSPQHPIFNEGSWLPAGQLKIGAAVLRFDASASTPQTVTLTEIGYVDQPESVYDITVTGCHTFFAQGIFVHNKQ